MVPDLQFVSAPSEWVVRCAPLIRSGGRVLDVACGTGRHTRFLIQAGFQVEAVDRECLRIGLIARCCDTPG